MSQKYDEYLEKHRQAVKKAYQWIAAYIPELTDVEATRNIEFHDMSKNTPDEYTPYDNYFYGEQTPAIIEAFNRAWLMHIHRNPHHWQHWVLINDEPKEGTILIEMPYPYIIEMICDWWAFSWIKGDLSEMFAWYKDHESYIKLHNNTRSIVEEILEMIRTKLTKPSRTLSVKKTKDFIGCCIHCFTCVSWLTLRSKVGLFWSINGTDGFGDERNKSVHT